MATKTPLYIIDAFSDRPFGGNPAAVCLLEAYRDERWMQNVAAEMNLSETAFLRPVSAYLWALRWFTPTVEVDLCGHATLAAVHVLRSECGVTANDVTFRTRSGDLTAHCEGEAICLDFPKVSAEPAEPMPEFCEAIGVEVVAALRSRDDLILVLPDAETVERLAPDHGKIRHLAPRGVVVTARAEEGADWDFVSRFFAPQSGIPEDPVTGSAHCYLGPYWGEILNKTQLSGYQVSARGGAVGVKLAGDRVMLQGRATTVLKGELHA